MGNSEELKLHEDLDINRHSKTHEAERNITFGIDEIRNQRKPFPKGLRIYFCLILIISVFCALYICQSYFHFGSYGVVVPTKLYCHYITTNDRFPVVNDSFKFPEKSIFFHETSCSGKLNERQACSVESAAKTHPDWQINVFFSASSVKSYTTSTIMKKLLKYPNIKYYRIHIEDYAKGTPLEPLVRSGVLKASPFKAAHTADVLRFITLYKWSGLYLDLDVIMARSTETLAKSYAGKEDNDLLGSAVLSFGSDFVGRKVANDCIRDMNKNYNKDEWCQGPAVITRVLRQLCKGNTRVMYMNASICSGFEVYHNEYFYPVHYLYSHSYFKYQKKITIGKSYGYHLFNKISSKNYVDKGSLFDVLSKKFCPVVYQINDDIEEDFE